MKDYRGTAIGDSAKKKARKAGVPTKPTKASEGPIAKTMIVSDIIALCPEAEKVVSEYGLHCFNCSANALETLEEGCLSHGFEQDEIDELVDDLNILVTEMPERPSTLTITAPAAGAVKKILADEGKTDHGLVVTTDGHGGFCMEFRKGTEGDEEVFTNTEEPTVRFFASRITLKRIGGSTIDFRDGRFKLDMDDAQAAHNCACGGSCDCSKK